MNLTRYTDYSLRVLLYLGLKQDERTSIQEIADFYRISKDHLVKVVHNLGKLGYLTTVRGRNGGIRLSRPSSEVNIGQLIRDTEPNFHLVECFDSNKNHCKVTPVCNLKHILHDAMDQFLGTLDRYTLEDLVDDRHTAMELVGLTSHRN